VKNLQGIQGAGRLFKCQLGLTFLFACLILIGMRSPVSGLSALLGGFVSILPNAYFARRFFKQQEASAARQIVKGFYQGEALKIFLTIFFFIVVLKCFTLIPWVFFAAYIMSQMVFWAAPWLWANGSKQTG
jgi:ATP synthase protein I